MKSLLLLMICVAGSQELGSMIGSVQMACWMQKMLPILSIGQVTFFFLFWRCVPIIKIFYRKQGCHTKCAMVLFLSNPGVHGVCSETKFVLRHPSGRGWLPAHVADDWLRSIRSWTGGGEGCKGSACVSPWIATNDMLLT
jgi:hypothetical protein